jgi:hypothetical protein
VNVELRQLLVFVLDAHTIAPTTDTKA